MKYKSLIVLIVGAALAANGGLVLGADQARDPTRAQDQTQLRTQDQIYGSQLMTQEERAAHQAKMRAAKTEQEREQIRAEHHKQMQERAKQQGVTLPDEPPARGRGGGPGPGPGGGMGPGGGRR
ncbi:MAG: hypothetical protein JSW09_08225 [Pseudomonadota bacterium]|nr:MAG: hypothetical protein JSW09_08225 [Pseudomonadota bacterium]